MPISRATVDALPYGAHVRLVIDGLTLEGPVTGQNGYKAVQGRALRLADASTGTQHLQIMYTYMYTGSGYEPVAHTKNVTSTGYPEYVLTNGTLTVLQTTGHSPGT